MGTFISGYITQESDIATDISSPSHHQLQGRGGAAWVPPLLHDTINLTSAQMHAAKRWSTHWPTVPAWTPLHPGEWSSPAPEWSHTGGFCTAYTAQGRTAAARTCRPRRSKGCDGSTWNTMATQPTQSRKHTTYQIFKAWPFPTLVMSGIINETPEEITQATLSLWSPIKVKSQGWDFSDKGLY